MPYYGNTCSSYSYDRPSSKFDREGLSSMILFIQQYDEAFERFAKHGGSMRDIQILTQLLQKKFIIRGPYGEAQAQLSEPKTITRALTEAGQYDVHFGVRRIDLGLPTYYLSRIRHDYWTTYGLIVEDLYRSQRYILDEPRFVKLLHHGYNTHFLRIADFRDDVEQLYVKDPSKQHEKTDELLYTLGRYVLQGAWHADQRFSFMVANALGLPELKQVIELAYMCLSCDLCALRRHLNEDVLHFFKDVYPNAPLSQLILKVPTLNGNQFTGLSQVALNAYVEITEFFNNFLKTNLEWQAMERASFPLWKLILSNMNRLALVAQQTKQQPAFQEARSQLKEETTLCIDRLLQAAS